MMVLPVEFTPEEFEFALGISILLALLSLYFFTRNWKRLRIIQNTPTARLRSAHQGYIELEGKGQLVDDQPIHAPLSNHACLWYRSQIEQQESFVENGRTQTRWNVIYKTTSDHRFKLTDGVNNCIVDPGGAEVSGEEKLVWYGNAGWPVRTQILESQSIVHAMANGYRYTEWLVLPGQSLYILGQFRTWSAVTQKSVRDVMINLINDWKQDQPALRQRFDINRDGNIDQEEWEIARREARFEAQQIHNQLVLEPDTNIIVKPNNPTQPFIISVYPQALLARKYRSNAYIAFTACVMFTCIAAWLLHVNNG